MKNRQINFRVPEDIYQLLKECAAVYDIDVATYVKICCIDITKGAWRLDSDAAREKTTKNTRQVNFSVSEEIYGIIKEAAEEYELNITQFAKNCCIQTIYNKTIPNCGVRRSGRNCHASLAEPGQRTGSAVSGN